MFYRACVGKHGVSVRFLITICTTGNRRRLTGEPSEDAGPDSRFIRCEWKMDYKMMANTGNSDSTMVHSPLDVFV